MNTVKQNFDKTELKNLMNAIVAAKWVKNDRAGNKEKWETLKEAARPVLNTWDKSFDLTEDDDVSHSLVEDTKTVKRIEIDQLAEYLIRKYIDKCTEYCDL